MVENKIKGMEYMKQKTCCIIGSKSTIDEGMKAFIQKNLEDLIEHQAVSKFIVGNESNFEILCDKIIQELKLKYQLELLLFHSHPIPFKKVLAEKYKQNYDFVIFSEEKSTDHEQNLIYRNHWMADHSDTLILYMKDASKPEKDLLHYIVDRPIQIRNIIL